MSNIKEMVFESRCQKCQDPVRLTRLAELKGPIEGSIYTPDRLLCAKCLSVLTTIVRKRRDDEKKKDREKSKKGKQDKQKKPDDAQNEVSKNIDYLA